MVREELVPYLNRRFGTRLPGCSLTLRFVGLGQSQVDKTLEDHVPLAPDVTLSSQFEGSRVDFTFSLPDDTAQDRARLEALKQKILVHLGDYVYAEDGGTSLEEHVVRLLAARNAKLAIAEAGSGGALAAGMHGAEGAGRALGGAYVAPSEQALGRLLGVPDDQWTAGTSGAEKAGLLAAAVAGATASSWAVAVGEARQDQGGPRYVQVAFRLPDGSVEGQRLRLRGDDSARLRLTTQLLDQLRRRLR